MRELKISERADPAYLEAFRTLVKKLVGSAKPGEPIAMFLAGGAAMHFYTGERISDDVDAVFDRKLLLPRDAAAIYRDSAGKARTVFFDTNYNETFGLMHENAHRQHENAHRDALRLPLEVAGARIFVLQPLDLAVSKLARFAEVDRADIAALGRAGLITARELRSRAETALPGYVGDVESIRTSIDIACGDLELASKKMP